MGVVVDRKIVDTPSPIISSAWWTTDRTLAAIGLVATLAGLAVAFWQLQRTRRAAEEAANASEATRRSLRSSDLGRAVDLSIEIARRIDSTTTKTALRLHFADWLSAYQRIHGLATIALTSVVAQPFTIALENARGEVLIAREALDSAGPWANYSRATLRRVLTDYSAAAEQMLVVKEGVVRQNAI